MTTTNGRSNSDKTVYTNANPSTVINPYTPRYSDLLSRVSNFAIIESTLRGYLFTIYKFFLLSKENF